MIKKNLQNKLATEHPRPHRVTPLLPLPSGDLNALWNLGVAGVPLPQYLKWADEANLFVAMADRGESSIDEVVSSTTLTKRGADAVLGILCALALVLKNGDRYTLSEIAREYLDKRKPYYVGLSLYGMLDQKMPKRLIQKTRSERHYSKAIGSWWYRMKSVFSRYPMGGIERLRIQHSRNFPASVLASRKACFDGIRHLVDIAGGSGVFAIPLALERPELRVTLVELPEALPHVSKFLEEYRVQERVELKGFNVHQVPWPIEHSDGILLGNFLHSCSDQESANILRECFRILPSGGRVFVHEMLWNENKDGPLVTALWNFWLISVSGGRQRTSQEFVRLMSSAGFEHVDVFETHGGFSLLVASKP